MSNIGFNDIELEDIDCPIGCDQSDEFIVSARDRLHHLPGVYTVVRCNHCGLMRTNPRPTQESILFYYPKDYGPYAGTIIHPESKKKVSDSFPKRVLKKVFQLNIQRIPQLKPGCLLEIGCASGSFLAYMANQGWDVSGIEISPIAASSARQFGLKVHCGPISSVPRPEKPYDLIVGWMVFEHLHQPLEELARLGRWLKDDGVLVLSIPNAASFEFRIFKDAWFALQLPTHLFHYTPESIRMILAKGGFSLLRIFPQRIMANIFKSMANQLTDNNKFPVVSRYLFEFSDSGWKRHYALYPLAYLLGLSGQSSRMTIWAKKGS